MLKRNKRTRYINQSTIVNLTNITGIKYCLRFQIFPTEATCLVTTMFIRSYHLENINIHTLLKCMKDPTCTNLIWKAKRSKRKRRWNFIEIYYSTYAWVGICKQYNSCSSMSSFEEDNKRLKKDKPLETKTYAYWWKFAWGHLLPCKC